ncbi:MAG: hypothetical protein ACTSX8_00505 [Alphaproteobacteria bacterium]
MALVTMGGAPVLKARIEEPLAGFWVADVEVDTFETLEGAQTISFGDDVSFAGQVWRGGVEQGRWLGRIVAGSATRATVELDAKNYLGASVSTILGDVLAATGDTLAPSSDSSVLAGLFPRWHRARGSAAKALQRLSDGLGVNVRGLRSGDVFFGSETYPDFQIEDTIEIDRYPQRGMVVLAPALPLLLPGITFEDRRVSYVVTTSTAHGLRQQLWFDDGGTN